MFTAERIKRQACLLEHKRPLIKYFLFLLLYLIDKIFSILSQPHYRRWNMSEEMLQILYFRNIVKRKRKTVNESFGVWVWSRMVTSKNRVVHMNIDDLSYWQVYQSLPRQTYTIYKVKKNNPVSYSAHSLSICPLLCLVFWKAFGEKDRIRRLIRI